MSLFELLKRTITNPADLLLALRLLHDLTDGSASLDAQTRGQIQAKILELEGEPK